MLILSGRVSADSSRLLLGLFVVSLYLCLFTCRQSVELNKVLIYKYMGMLESALFFTSW